MVSLISVAIAGSLGLLVYILVPLVANMGGIETRQRVGRSFFKMAARLLKQFTFLRRVLSGYDVLPITVDDEQKLLKLTLDSSRLGSDEEYPFNDPDGRIKRLFNKPVAMAFELVPAALDAELSEIGRWVREKRDTEGLWRGDWDDAEMWNDDGKWEGTVDPWVTMPAGVHLVDPIDTFEIVPNDVNPENVKSAEIFTKKRYEKYKSIVGLEDALATAIGFLVGAGGMAGLAYVRDKLLDGGSGLSGPVIDYEMMLNPAAGALTDMVVVLI